MIRLAIQSKGRLNEAAFDRTVDSGLVTFWSRSREELWTKGETSGNYLRLKEMYADCDADTLLVVNNIMGVSLDDIRKELLSRHNK